MIETIYKIEGNENKKPDINIRLPKNIRQIGQNGKNMDCQIYIEENVLSYIKQTPNKESQIRYGVLLGDIKQGNGYTYIFINGMVEVDEVIEDSIIFSDEVWTGIYDSIRMYYREGIIVGWYASFEHEMTRDMPSIRKIHLDHFAGNNKVFLNINREDDEEAFYVYERNGLGKQPCYHVYFEKSVEFEDYIFGNGKDEAALKEKENVQKSNGKYGIALNNNIGNNTSETSKEGGILNKLTKEGEKLTKGGIGRVASFVTIIALAGVLGVMGSNGGLDALGNKVKGFVNGIINSSSNGSNSGNIIEVDGVPTNQQQSSEELSTIDVSAEASTSGTTSTENLSTENNSQETTSKDNSQEITTKDEKNEANADANKPANGEEQTTSTVNKEEETTEKTQATISDINTTYASYTVKDGETIYSIAMLFYGTTDMIDDIMKLNDIKDENYVMEGQKIFLP